MLNSVHSPSLLSASCTRVAELEYDMDDRVSMNLGLAQREVVVKSMSSEEEALMGFSDAARRTHQTLQFGYGHAVVSMDDILLDESVGIDDASPRIVVSGVVG